jgi:CheY-like chemotaxis protein
VARVLVVDDHRNTRESLAWGLRSYGLEADTAGSAAEALARVEHGDYDWIVCDVRMPGTSGLDLARALRANAPDLGLLLMTAFDTTPAEHRLIETIGAALLIKPVTADQLLAEYLAPANGEG